MTFPIGAHSTAANPLDDVRALGTDAVQLTLGDPQSWKKPTFDVPGFGEDTQTSGVHVIVHSPFVINVASTNNRIRIPSRRLLQQHLDAAAQIGAKGVVVHGGHVTADDDPAAGVDNWRKCIDGLTFPVPLLIENTAGGQHAMARYLEALARLWEAIADADSLPRVGFCLDTCHAFAAGLDMETLVDDVLAITGRIDLIHLNDSQGGPGSGRDRHANLGEGEIAPEVLVDVVRAAQAPVILETPGGPQAHARDLEWLHARL